MCIWVYDEFFFVLYTVLYVSIIVFCFFVRFFKNDFLPTHFLPRISAEY